MINADPDAAVRRREEAEREDARVRFFRDQAGTCGLAGYSLPADEALKASQGISGRARTYRAWGIGGTMEHLRVLAFLDLLTSRDARNRYPRTTPAKPGKRKTGTAHGDGQARGGSGHRTAEAGCDGDAAGRDQTAQDKAGRDEEDWDSLLSDGPADDDEPSDGDDDAQDRDDDADGEGEGEDGNGGNGGHGPGDDRGRPGRAAVRGMRGWRRTWT